MYPRGPCIAPGRSVLPEIKLERFSTFKILVVSQLQLGDVGTLWTIAVIQQDVQSRDVLMQVSWDSTALTCFVQIFLNIQHFYL